MSFSILDYLDKLEPNPKEKGKYVSPKCKDNNLGINPKTGAYSCHSNHCDPAAIRNKIAPLPQGKGQPYQSRPKKKPSAREREKAVQLDSARIEAKVDELLLLVGSSVHTFEQAQVELSTWAKAEGYDTYTAGQLFKAKAKELGLLGDSKTDKPKLSWKELKERLTKLWEIPSESEQWLELQTLAQQSHYRVPDLKELALKLKTPPPATFSEWAMPVGEFLKLDLGADEELLEGFLPCNRLILISSKGGVGKTLLAYDLVAALADGVPWCGFQSLRSHKVIIVQTDESKGDCQERLAARGVNPDNVFVTFQFTPAFLSSLKQWVKEVGATVVLFDSLTSIQRDSGLTYKDPAYGNFPYDLKDMAQELGVTPIVITHTNKSNPQELGIDNIAGSYAVGAAASEIFVVDRSQEGKNTLRVLNRIKSRKYEREAYLVELNPEDYTHSFEGVCHPDGCLKGGETDTGEINGSARDKVKAYLAKNPGVKFQTSDLSEALGISENTIRLQLSNLFRQHLVKREKAKGKGNQPYQYWLPLPKLQSELTEGEVLRLINLASSDLESYRQQVAQLPAPQKEQLYSEMPTLRVLERC